MRHFVWTLAVATFAMRAAELTPTPGPNGPYHVSANRILDREGHSFLLRGTALAPVVLDPVQPGDLGGLSASALVTIRQRLNMNAVELPVDPAEFWIDREYRDRTAEIVRDANRFDLLVVLSPGGENIPEGFWRSLAEIFRGQPNVFFDALNPAALAAIRAAGAQQPAIVDAGSFDIPDANVIYRIAATYADADRWKRLASLADHAPVVVAGLDPQLTKKSAECDAFPADPGAATQTVQADLDYFDLRGISWMISGFVPGLLITDTRTFTGTKLDDGWACGAPSSAGLGMVLLGHLWHTDPHGLFLVNQGTGGFVLARGGRATAYGPTMADHTVVATPGRIPPTVMDNVSVRITDARGIARLAPILNTGAGWAFLNFVVPEEIATGPAEVAIIRRDGSQSSGHAIVADVAAGLYSASMDARGPANAVVTQRLANGLVRSFAASACTGGLCSCVPIPLSEGIVTTLRLMGTGFRHSQTAGDLQATVGEAQVPVVSFGRASDFEGNDQVTVRLPDRLIGAGEMDVLVRVRGTASNVVRIACGRKR